MSKIKLFTHTDLDGIGCAILAYLAFGRDNVDVEYCDYDDVDGKVEDFWKRVGDAKYDSVYITDISISEELVARIATHTGVRKWHLFDHHATALGLNRFEWCEVRVTATIGKQKTSGTEMFFKHLVDFDCLQISTFKSEVINNIIKFVKIVRDYDTWRWKELGEEGIVCKQLNDLFYIYGREKFIEWIIRQICEIDYISPLQVFPYFSEVDKALLDSKQKEIDIYVEEKNEQLRIATDQFGKSFGWVFAERCFSELGNRLCELHPEIEYVAVIDISHGTVSFRSVKDDADLGGEIAHSFGGGGHKKAAGSRFDADDVSNLLACKIFKGNIMNYLLSKQFPAPWISDKC